MTRSKTLLMPAALALILGLHVGCAKRVYMKSDPSGATVTLDDGRVLGTTPLLLKEDVWVWTGHEVTFTKEGYAPRTLKLNAKARPGNVAACGIGSCVMWMVWPICIIGEYRKYDYRIKLRAGDPDDPAFEEIEDDQF